MHLEIIRQGVESWNEFRQGDLMMIKPDLSEAGPGFGRYLMTRL